MGVCATTGKGGLGARPRAGVILAAKGRAPRPPFPVVTHTPHLWIEAPRLMSAPVSLQDLFNFGSDQRGSRVVVQKHPLIQSEKEHATYTSAHATCIFNFGTLDRIKGGLG